MTKTVMIRFVFLFVTIHSVALSANAQTITFSAVGDVFFGRGGKQYGTDDPFRYVKSEFAGRDLVFGNLETPICEERSRVLTTPCSLKRGTCKTENQLRYRRLYFLTFQARLAAAKLLKGAGFSVVSTANNHAEDQGGEKILETLHHLNEAKVGAVGSGPTKDAAWMPYVYEKNGVKIGIIAATSILNFKPTEKDGFLAHGTTKQLTKIVPPIVKSLKSEVDFVVVTLHYGVESSEYPSPRERKLVEAIAEAGADVFVGTHPHVLQGIQVLNDTVVFWSLGNFLFDAPRTDWCESGIVHIDFVKNKNAGKMKNIRFIPVTLSGDPKRLPIPANPDRANAIVKKVVKLSKRYRNPKNALKITNNIIEVNIGSDEPSRRK